MVEDILVEEVLVEEVLVEEVLVEEILGEGDECIEFVSLSIGSNCWLRGLYVLDGQQKAQLGTRSQTIK